MTVTDCPVILLENCQKESLLAETYPTALLIPPFVFPVLSGNCPPPVK